VKQEPAEATMRNCHGNAVGIFAIHGEEEGEKRPWLEPYNKSAPNSAIGALLAVGCWLSAAFADRAIQAAGKSYPSPRSWSERCHRE